jgi:hypothetical protein|nr:MAG TPA: hypothetical protein [Caudoviricetes sp.]
MKFSFGGSIFWELSMAREDKLKPVRTKEEASERGRKGGIASGIARREKKTFRATLELLLDRKLEGSSLTGREAVAVALFEKAMSGDVKAFQELRDTVGEKPVDKQELSGPDGEAVTLRHEVSAEIADMLEKVKGFQE